MKWVWFCCRRYVMEDNRAVLRFQDGSQAWDAKAFLLEQDRLKELTLEGQIWGGRSEGYGVRAEREEEIKIEL